MKKIVLTGGGTGGHVIPNISLLPYLKRDFDSISYIGSNSIEKDLITPLKDVEFYEIPAYKFNRTQKVKNLLLPFQLVKSISKSLKILKKIKPDIVFSKGGYVSVPVCISAKILNIPIVSHESDLTLGKANKLIYKLSKSMCTTFEKTSQGLKKGVFTGAPIRKELFNGNKNEGYRLVNFENKNKPVLMVTGGSTGAKDLNEIVFKAVPTLVKHFNVIHLVGKNKMLNAPKLNGYCPIEFCKQIEHLFKISDIVVSRAGSGAIYEILALNKPMILVPLPKGNSRGDQEENAKYFAEKGYAINLPQDTLTPKKLVQEIMFLYSLSKNDNNKSQIKKVSLKHINGSENIYKEIIRVNNLCSNKKKTL